MQISSWTTPIRLLRGLFTVINFIFSAILVEIPSFGVGVAWFEVKLAFVIFTYKL